MKLLLCTKCSDVFALRQFEKKCHCGKSKGQYIDNINAEYSGEFALLLGFSNSSLILAIVAQRKEGDHPDGCGREFTAFVIPSSANSIKRK